MFTAASVDVHGSAQRPSSLIPHGGIPLLLLPGTYKIKHHPDGPGTEKELELDFTPPFKRISMISGLEEVSTTTSYLQSDF